MKTVFSLVFLAVAMTSPFSYAESGASEHSGQASKHSALAVSHATVASAQVASGVIAVPVVAVGAVSLAAGSVVQHIGEELVEVADDFSQPLVITEKIITVDPAPNKVLETEQELTTTTVTKTKVETITVEKTQ